jgi:23S rRNA pseudouridine1911/1915/1917 synthase
MQDLSETGDATLTVTIGENPPDRLDKALAREVPEEAALSRTRLMKMIAEGDVLQGGTAITDPKTKVVEGEVFVLRLAPSEDYDAMPEAIPLSVIYEDADLIVINKPVGMVVHPAPGTPSGTLVNALLHHCGDTLSGIGGERRPGIVHRIDKDTTGLLVVAKSDRAHHGRWSMLCPMPATRVCAAQRASALKRAASCASPRGLPATRRIVSAKPWSGMGRGGMPSPAPMWSKAMAATVPP